LLLIDNPEHRSSSKASFEDTSFTDTKFGAISNINYIGKILKDLLISLALEDISAQAI
jgi:hypothetical protein